VIIIRKLLPNSDYPHGFQVFQPSHSLWHKALIHPGPDIMQCSDIIFVNMNTSSASKFRTGPR
jgi:hypothetical protein